MEEGRVDRLAQLFETEVTKSLAALEIRDAFVELSDKRPVADENRELFEMASEYAVEALRFIDVLRYRSDSAYSDEDIERALRSARIYRERLNQTDAASAKERGRPVNERARFIPDAEQEALVREMIRLGAALSMEDNIPAYSGEEYGERVRYNKYGKSLPS